MVGETVRVLSRTTSTDGHGELVEEFAAADVENVVVAPGSNASPTGATHTEAVRVDVTCHFPKTYNQPLRGCRLVVRGLVYDVVGDPMWYPPGECPGAWNYPVEAVRADG